VNCKVIRRSFPRLVFTVDNKLYQGGRFGSTPGPTRRTESTLAL
jgi:hypothetical protein